VKMKVMVANTVMLLDLPINGAGGTGSGGITSRMACCWDERKKKKAEEQDRG